MKINLNDEVTFIITTKGLEVLAAEDRRLGMKSGLTAEVWRHDSKTNQCRAPLWEVMHIFGPLMHMGSPISLIANNTLEVTSQA